jgi:geranylgeranyl diphosphate synthase, type II
MTADPTTSLALYRRHIDLRLAALLPPVLPGHSALSAALRDGILAPGKRLRPIMTVLAAEDLGGDAMAAIDAGCAVELVHAASLVLDDLPCMDNAKLRRGLPAVHVGHGEDLAVLVSISAVSLAYQLISEIQAIPAQARLDGIAVLAKAVGVSGLVAGQFEDLRGGRTRRAVAEIHAANGLKTGALFSAAVETGAVVAGADPATRKKLRSFAAELGHAFQLLDDLLDLAPNSGVTGKDVGSDEGKSTILSIIGRDSTRRRIDRHIEAAQQCLDEIFGAQSRLHGLVSAIVDQALPAPPPAAYSNDDSPGELGQEIGAR